MTYRFETYLSLAAVIVFTAALALAGIAHVWPGAVAAIATQEEAPW